MVVHLRRAEDLEAEVRADLRAELAAGAAVQEERIAVALAVHGLRHDEHPRRTDRHAQHAALAELDVDRDGRARHAAASRAQAAPSARSAALASAIAARWLGSAARIAATTPSK